MIFLPELVLKDDHLLPGGSYKIRGVREFFNTPRPETIKVLSAGNLAIACALESKRLGKKCVAFVPQGVSEKKKTQLELLGAVVEEIPFSELWSLVGKDPNTFGDEILHPFHPDLLRGYGSIIDEILLEYPQVRSVVIPFGIGGLTLALLQRIRERRLTIDLIIAEVHQHSPLKHLQDGRGPTPKLQSFIEALGAPHVLPHMQEALRPFSPRTVVEVTIEDVKQSIRFLHSRLGQKIEGAAGASLAAARKLRQANTVTLLTGSNISDDVFHNILEEKDGSHHQRR